ncbi:PAS domain-containing protein [Psychromonas sp. 14N.309.X.WAT.B.A12]|uniref:PAS domain-containing protein n=1 Tax=unclassified Psychromonas TaxID=2614957 RepID=UPI0025B1A112|nr:PAS domain-containing protein [Psychromonas sp. 14N.309.X.WAT.B.A12]MDN2662196.1 PAS domain-containing protein [Psychromonas sp. 14N.309.X.WAT.B.A12]
MNKLRSLSLIILLPALLIVIFIVLQGSVLFMEYRQQQANLYIKSEQDLKGLAGQLQTSLSNSLMRLEKSQAQDFVSTAALNENVKTVAVVDNNQQVVLSNRFREKYMFAKLQLQEYQGELLDRVINKNEIIVKLFKENEELVVYAPLQMISKGNSLNRKFNGVIFIRYSLKSAFSALAYESILRLIKFTLVLLATLCLFVYLINILVVTPLKRFIASVNSIDINNPGSIDVSGLGEVGLLQRAFIRLVADVSSNTHRLEVREQRWANALNGARDGVWDWDVDSGEVYFSKRWKEMLGFHKENISNDITEWEHRVHPDDLYKVFEDLSAHFSGSHSFFENIHRMKCYNGEYRWILSRGQTVSWDTQGNPKRVIGTHIDLSLYKDMLADIKVESEIIEQKSDLPDREQLLLHIEVENKRLYQQGQQGVLIAFNCDRFKHIAQLSDSNKINELLYLVARRLEKHKLDGNFVAHIQEFQFAIFYEDIATEYEKAADVALALTKQLEFALQIPFKVLDEQFIVNCAFGLTLLPSKDLEARTILHQAVRALKLVEQGKDNNIQFYDKSLSKLVD